MTLAKTIFLKSGKTFTFRNVTHANENETVLWFNYTAMSDNKVKSVVFNRENIAGHSTYEEGS